MRNLVNPTDWINIKEQLMTDYKNMEKDIYELLLTSSMKITEPDDFIRYVAERIIEIVKNRQKENKWIHRFYSTRLRS